MEYGTILGGSFAYAKEAVFGKWMQWLLLIIATLLVCIPLMGYLVRVLRGDKPAPEVTDWVGLVIDGIKYFIISLIYAIPSIIILFVTFGSVLIAFISGRSDLLVSGLEGFFFGLAIFLVVAFICALFGTIGLIRFARTGSTGEAFNFVEIRETIGRIGWGAFTLALIILLVVQVLLGFVLSVITMIPVAGFIIEVVLVAPVAIFEARYLALVYENA